MADEDKYIPLYVLHEDALDADTFQAKTGDLLLGGGSGESPAFWIAMPEAVLFFTREDWEGDILRYATLGEFHHSLYHGYWGSDWAYIFCEGYRKLGWHPHERPIGLWLLHHILAFVLREYSGIWGHLYGSEPLEQDGSICRPPTPEERHIG